MRHADTRPLDLRRSLPPFLLGVLSVACQAYLLREFGAEFFGNELIFGLFLGSWLFWGGVGSLIRPPASHQAAARRLVRIYGLSVFLFMAGLVALRFSHRLLGILPAELAGLLPALGFAFALSLVLNLPLGHSFGLNAARHPGGAGAVYVLESAGAAAAGLAVHFGLIPRLSNWQGAALIAAAASVAVLAALRPRKRAGLVLAGTLLMAAGLAVLDGPAQKEAWKPLRLVETEDTPYGKLQVVRTEEQMTLFDNGLALFSEPDPGAAEESVHFALLQREGSRRVLLVGGGPGGGAAEALKYPGLRADCVEIDPAVVRLSKEHVPAGPGRAALDDPRVRVIQGDGRAFIARTGDRYDAILLDLPEPSTAQINRYYTVEFFGQARDKLRPEGILGFVVPAAENYISEPLGQFLGSIAATLRQVFANVAAVPGANCVFLASDGPLTTDPERLSAAAASLGLRLRSLEPGLLRARLEPGRVEDLARKISGPRTRINRDLAPVGYYFQSVLWAGQFRGAEAALLRAAGRLDRRWLLDAPLAVLAIGLAFSAIFRRRSAARHLVPVAVMGFTSIAAELAVFIAYQARFGSVYGKIPLLLALFMAGLAAGSAAARSRRRPAVSDMAVIQACFVALLAAASRVLLGFGGQAAIMAVLTAFGVLGGALFVTANRRLAAEVTHPGLAYGVDLLASFVGVVLASALIIPLFGIPALILRLTILNAICFLYLLASPRSTV